MKHLTIPLITLLVLGGCSNEIDRCIAFKMENNPQIESEIEYWASACGDNSSCTNKVRQEQEAKYKQEAKQNCHDEGIY